MKDKTLALTAGYEKDSQRTINVPIYQSTCYEFKDVEQAGNLFSLKELGNIYTRLMNPTTDVLEKRLAKLEHGSAAIATSSGMGAIFACIVNLAEAGDNILVATQAYGGTLTLVTHTIKRFGIEARFFDATNPDTLEDQIDKNTRGIFFESISNPSVDVAEFDRIVEIANKHNVITVVDNTVATPVLCKPLNLGCDVVVHSTSKYICGKSSSLGGVVIERENLVEKIKGNARYSQFNTPDTSYHGLVYSDVPLPLFTLRIRLAFLRDIGIAPSPFNSWDLLQSVETLELRVKEHSKNALQVANFLEANDKVIKVNYPFLESNSNYKRAKKYLIGHASGLLSFEVESYAKAIDIANNTELFSIVANIGDSRSLVIHPASTTHQQLNDNELKKAGVSKSLLRLSIGLEDISDLLADLDKNI